MGKASRARKERRRQHPGGRPGSGQDAPRASPAGSGPSSASGRAIGDSRAVELIAAALYARQAGQLHRFDELDVELAARQTAPATARSTERSLRQRLTEAVRTAWDRGWEPADLARLTGRELGPRHQPLIADLLADELGAYARATLDPRWPGQLAELGSRAWWDPEQTWLQARAERDPDGWPGVVGRGLELLALLLGLPTLTPIGALPGRAGPPGSGSPGAAAQEGTAEAAGRGVDERVLARVRALLAKAESTTFDAEAETFTAGAQALMARHSIDRALLAASIPGARPDTGARRVGIDNPYESAKAVLLESVARANRCRTVWSRSLGFSTLVGHHSDLAAVETLFTSLLVQATRAMTSAGSRTDGAGRSRTRAFRQSFLAAYAQRIGERLQQTAQEQTQEAAAAAGGRDLLPVLAARDEQVRQAVEAMFPDLVHHRMRSVTDREGWLSGTGAADRAVLQVGAALPG